MNTKLRASLVVEFEFDESEAVHILSDPTPKKALQDYLIARHGCAQEAYVCSHNSDTLARSLGEFLSNNRIKEAKQLAVSTGGATV